MKKIILILCSILVSLSLMGCMDKNSTVTEQENNSASVDTNQNASKSLVVYFSRAGENSSVGNIEKGNYRNYC